MKHFPKILLILTLSSFLSYGQRLRPTVVVTHTPVTESPKIPSKTEQITLVLTQDSVRIVTSLDTLSLTRAKHFFNNHVYYTKEGQFYHLTWALGKSGILVIISPLRPYQKEHLYSIQITTICVH